MFVGLEVDGIDEGLAITTMDGEEGSTAGAFYPHPELPLWESWKREPEEDERRIEGMCRLYILGR